MIDPLELMDKYGTDALRFTLLTGATPGNDMNLSESADRAQPQLRQQDVADVALRVSQPGRVHAARELPHAGDARPAGSLDSQPPAPA